MRKLFLTLSIFLLLGGAFIRPVSLVLAADQEPTTLNTIEPKLQIPIAPNFQFSKILTEANADNGQTTTFAYIPYLAEYFSMLYKYLIGAAGILAGIMIVIAGFEWLTAAGDAGKIKHAKGRISGALVGLILALGSYTVLFFINPDLVTFKNLKVQLVSYEDYDDEDGPTTPEDTEESAPIDPVCKPGWVNIRWPANEQSPQTLVSGPGLTRQILTTEFNKNRLLRVAALMAQDGMSIRGSGARSQATQFKLLLDPNRCTWSEVKRKYDCQPATANNAKMWLGKGQPNPTYAGCTHINSLDLFATGPNCGPACPPLKKATAKQAAACWATNPCQQKLIAFMLSNGFSVLMKPNVCNAAFEPWHFNSLPEGGLSNGTTDQLSIISTRAGEVVAQRMPGGCL